KIPGDNMRKLIAPVLLVAAALIGPSASAADAWPSKPITLMIPYPPGGSADMLARPVAARLEKKLGQTIVIDYRPGAGGSIATSQLARSEADGYTLLMVLAAHAINPSLYKSLPYDTRKDFAGVSMVATLPLLVAAPLATPADNMQELVDYARRNPGKLTFASAGNGNTSHLAGEMFNKVAGTEMLHVPYKGSGPAVVALLGGEVSLMFDSISTSMPHVKSGKLKGLAVTGPQRSPLLPDLPTVAESGVPDVVVEGWYGLIAPAGTAADVLNSLSTSIADVLAERELKQQLEGFGYRTVGSTPEAFDRHIHSEIDRWGEVVKAS